MSDLPFIAFGNDELEKKPPIKEGDRIKCRLCPEFHIVECGTDKTGKKCTVLLFYECGKQTYLAGVDGRSVL